MKQRNVKSTVTGQKPDDESHQNQSLSFLTFINIYKTIKS